MELRNHPKMRWQGRSNWPPEWIGPYGPERPLPKGEVGALSRVECASKDVNIPHCILYLRWNGQDYFGSLYFDDVTFMAKLCDDILKGEIGCQIRDIGSLDIPG
jgi:hypothetical protein